MVMSTGFVVYQVTSALTRVIRDAERARASRPASPFSSSREKLHGSLFTSPGRLRSPVGEAVLKGEEQSLTRALEITTTIGNTGDGSEAYASSSNTRFDPARRVMELERSGISETRSTTQDSRHSPVAPLSPGSDACTSSVYARSKARLKRLVITSTAILAASLVVLVASLIPGTIASVRTQGELTFPCMLLWGRA